MNRSRFAAAVAAGTVALLTAGLFVSPVSAATKVYSQKTVGSYVAGKAAAVRGATQSECLKSRAATAAKSAAKANTMKSSYKSTVLKDGKSKCGLSNVALTYKKVSTRSAGTAMKSAASSAVKSSVVKASTYDQLGSYAYKRNSKTFWVVTVVGKSPTVVNDPQDAIGSGLGAVVVPDALGDNPSATPSPTPTLPVAVPSSPAPTVPAPSPTATATATAVPTTPAPTTPAPEPTVAPTAPAPTTPAPTPTVVPTTPAPSMTESEAIARQVMVEANKARAAAGLKALNWSTCLDENASDWAAYLSARFEGESNFFANVSWIHRTSADRKAITAACVPSIKKSYGTFNGTVGDIIMRDTVQDGNRVPGRAVNGWLDSAPHKAWLMYPSSKDAVVHVAKSKRHNAWIVVMDIARPAVDPGP